MTYIQLQSLLKNATVGVAVLNNRIVPCSASLWRHTCDWGL